MHLGSLLRTSKDNNIQEVSCSGDRKQSGLREMSNSTAPDEMTKSLEETKKILVELRGRISRIKERLDPIERTLRVREFSHESSVLAGTSHVYVILPTALCDNDPIGNSIRETELDNDDRPTMVQLRDPTESEKTCRAINRIIEADLLRFEREGNLGPRSLVIMRWSEMSEDLGNKSQIIIGRRYFQATTEQGIKFNEAIEECGIGVVDDIGEFGGGPLVFHLARNFSGLHHMFIIQISISRKMAADAAMIQKILKCLATIQV